MQDGVCVERHEGTPQGGPLSPLLANLLLDDLDKELERRGHRFCRYADDCNIYVQSKAAGERVLASRDPVPGREAPFACQPGEERGGPRRGTQVPRPPSAEPAAGWGSPPGVSSAPRSGSAQITRRNRGVSLEQVIGELNSFLTGWVTYFRHAACKTHLNEMDDWLRRKLRCVRLKQCKRRRPLADFLRSRACRVERAG